MEGKIVKNISNLYTVSSLDKLYDCKARGKIKYENLTPLVGDIVEFNEKDNYILKIKQRKNSLDRPMIANVDSALIITSVKKPDLSLLLLDKELTLCIKNNIEPIIVFTKLDLLTKSELKKIKQLFKYYSKIGIKVTTNNNLYKLKRYIRNKTLVLTGQTGAGKSTLLNKLDKKLNLATNEISEALGRGKHTTRHVELFKYKTSLIADTPGFSSLDLKDFTKEEIKNTFIEFKDVECPFKDCTHTKEKECKIKELVNNKIILKSRYDNYISMVSKNENSSFVYKK